MLSWNDSDLARVRREELLRDAEKERLLHELRSDRSDGLRRVAPLVALAPRIVPLALAVSVLALALR